jgi:hypothetical protein
MKLQRQLEVGTMRVRGAVGTGEIFRARANGFPPRPFVSGKPSAVIPGTHLCAGKFRSKNLPENKKWSM